MNNKPIKTVSDLYPREWLHPDDITRPLVIAIENVQIEMRYNVQTKRNEPKLIVYFHNARRHLIANKTQAFALAEATGTEEFGKWKGHLVQIAVGEAPNRKPTITIASPPEEEPAPSDEETDTRDEIDRTFDPE